VSSGVYRMSLLVVSVERSRNSLSIGNYTRFYVNDWLNLKEDMQRSSRMSMVLWHRRNLLGWNLHIFWVRIVGRWSISVDCESIKDRLEHGLDTVHSQAHTCITKNVAPEGTSWRIVQDIHSSGDEQPSKASGESVEIRHEPEGWNPSRSLGQRDQWPCYWNLSWRIPRTKYLISRTIHSHSQWQDSNLRSLRRRIGWSLRSIDWSSNLLLNIGLR
jgi:hypothetical protein